jgi:hypothetical protein
MVCVCVCVCLYVFFLCVSEWKNMPRLASATPGIPHGSAESARPSRLFPTLPDPPAGGGSSSGMICSWSKRTGRSRGNTLQPSESGTGWWPASTVCHLRGRGKGGRGKEGGDEGGVRR